MFKFSDITEIQGQSECVTQKNVFNAKKKMTEKINDRSETEFALVEYALNMNKTPSNDTVLASDIPNIINEEHVIIVSGQKEKPVFILSNELCEGKVFPYLRLKCKFG